MIAFVKGTVAELFENSIVLDCGTIGYQIFMPPSTVAGSMRKGEEIKVYTYLHVKEDLMQLYGFLYKDDLEIFKLLIGVNGIGPKGALGILSELSTDDLRFAILSDDAAAIAKAPGIGKKTASKLILELKDKLNLQDAIEQKLVRESQTTDSSSSDNVMEAVQALVALGYSNSDALRTIKTVEGAENMDVEELLKQALRKISIH